MILKMIDILGLILLNLSPVGCLILLILLNDITLFRQLSFRKPTFC